MHVHVHVPNFVTSFSMKPCASSQCIACKTLFPERSLAKAPNKIAPNPDAPTQRPGEPSVCSAAYIGLVLVRRSYGAGGATTVVIDGLGAYETHTSASRQR